MREPLSLFPGGSRQSLLQRVEDAPLWKYLIVFLAVVILCGWLYSGLTVHGHGVDKPGLGFLSGIYFSIVTVTSLGYGDISPVGLSRLIVGLEVLFGLAIMGIMIAKATSRRLAYYVQRLYVVDAQRHLDDFATRFLTTRASLAADMTRLGYAYVPTPSPQPAIDRPKVLADFQQSIMELRATSHRR